MFIQNQYRIPTLGNAQKFSYLFSSSILYLGTVAANQLIFHEFEFWGNVFGTAHLNLQKLNPQFSNRLSANEPFISTQQREREREMKNYLYSNNYFQAEFSSEKGQDLFKAFSFAQKIYCKNLQRKFNATPSFKS